MSKMTTIIVHFVNKDLGENKLDEIAKKLSEISGLNVLCFDKEVKLNIIESEQDNA